MSSYLRRDEKLLTPDGIYSVCSIQSDSERVELMNQSTGGRHYATIAALRCELSNGNWKRISVNPITGETVDLTNNPKARRRQQFNIAVLDRLKALMRNGSSAAEAIRALQGTTIETGDGSTKMMCSERTAYRILRDGAENPLKLIPAYAARGNHVPRYSESVKELILSATEAVYAVKKSKIQINGLAKHLTSVAIQRGLIPQDKTLSRELIKNVVVAHWNPDLDYKRLDPRIARSAKAVAKNRIVPGAPMHRVEQDTVHLPVLVKTAEGILQNPYLMVSVDCYSSVPLGWRLVPTPVTAEDTLECIEVGLFSKKKRFDQLGINCELDPCGQFLDLHLDNGSENRTERINELNTLGINITRAPAHSGHMKPFVERLHKSLKIALEGLPGFTRFEGEDGARTEEAKKDELMTLEQLERWIVRFFFERWIHQSIERFITADYLLDQNMGVTPAQRWKMAEEHFPTPLPPNRESWVQIRFLTRTASLSNKTGVSIDGFRFRGDNLAILIGQYGPNADVTVRYNPSDYRFVYVPDKNTAELIMLVNAEVTEQTPAFSFSEAKARRNHVRALAGPLPAVAKQFELDLAQASLAAPVRHSGGRKKGHREEQKAIRDTLKLAAAVDRAHTTPIPRAARESGAQTDSNDSFITDDSIPTFSVEKRPTQKSGGTST
ncbi:hypothetical protein CEW83_14145 [Parazoarcus communis]|uniref:Integrase catalytic domain-containing protein n=1 Tax=Parazoarcus communis TaxID=41977 RepID=A0A2U8GRS7_9RHOO|nr:Mu transposase C-terminal domain-containing protein [Parazoarcus communis]AWI76214.1 hypothetical protein CEW83_14145 [Parazoarcus communis]